MQPSTLPHPTGVGAAGHRLVHHTHHRFTRFDEGDVHRELPVAGHELTRAVQRVHQPKTRTWVGGGTAGGRFFGHDGHAGREQAQRGHDEGLGAFIGLGHRGCIGLAPHQELRSINLQDQVARLRGDALDLGQQIQVHQGLTSVHADIKPVARPGHHLHGGLCPASP